MATKVTIERSSNTRNIKRVALAAPVLLFAAHFGCSTPNQKEPPTAPSQTSGQQPNPVATPTPFIEQFGEGNQSSEPKINPATRVPTVSTPETQAEPTFNSDGNLVFKERGYNYTMYPDMTLDRLLGKTDAGQPNGWDILQYLKEKIDPQKTGEIQAIDDIRNLLMAAKQKELLDPKDPAIIKDVNSAANVLNVHCNNQIFAKGYMNGLASYVYRKKPQDWQNNKRIYLDGACFWGEKN